MDRVGKRGWLLTGAAAILLLTLAALPATAAADTTTTTQHTVFVALTPVLSCAGEFVDVTGNVKVLVHTTLHADGSQTMVTETNYQGVVGIGQISGLRYTSGLVSKTTTHTAPLEAPDIQIADNVHLIRAQELGPDDTRFHFNMLIQDGVIKNSNVRAEPCQ